MYLSNQDSGLKTECGMLDRRAQQGHQVSYVRRREVLNCEDAKQLHIM